MECDLINAVIYARYSSHNQRDESIEGQLRECHEFANKNEMTVIGEYCDHAISGKTDKRPQFQKLIKDSDKGHFEAVIMYTLDRFARNRYDSAIYKAKLKKNGVKVYYAKQPMPDTPEGIILESVLEGYAEYYSENLSRNVKRGMKDNALKGLSVGQPTPLGYVIGHDKRYKIDPIGAKIIREIFQRYADGMSVSQIVNWCNDQGYKTSRGNKFTKNSLTCILQNEKYTGKYKFMDIEIDGGMPQIIDKDLFEKVQSMRKRNYKSRARSKAKEQYLLTTKVFCGYCGAPMIGESGTSKSGMTYHYYKCANRKNKKIDCNKRTEKKDVLEAVVVRYTVNTVLTDENIEKIAKKAIELIKKEASDNSYLNSLKDRLKTVENKIENILTAIEDGLYTPSTKDRLVAFESEKEDLEIQISKESMKKPTLTEDHIIFWLQSFKNGDIHDKKYQQKIIDTLVNSVFVYDDKIVFTFNLSEKNTATLKCSDIEDIAPPNCLNPNTPIIIKHCFVFCKMWF